MLFERQAQITFNKENLKQLALELGLEAEPFNTCLDSDRYNQVVIDDTARAASFGITGTPTLLINEVFIQGAQPFEAFQQIIESELTNEASP